MISTEIYQLEGCCNNAVELRYIVFAVLTSLLCGRVKSTPLSTETQVI